MQLTKVNSTQIAAIGYNQNTKELFIEYKNNAVYKYINVPETVYNGILAAKSVGKYVSEYVKCAGYDYEKVESMED